MTQRMNGDWKVLIIDDEEGIRTLLSITLEDLGCNVLIAPDGKTGVRICQDESPQIVITDVRMPDLDGIEILKRIKREDPFKEVIVVTGYQDLTIAIQALQLNASDFITKPISHDAITVALERAKERYSTRRRLRDSEELYSDLVESSLTGIYIDQDGKIVFANRQFVEVYGYDREEVLGMESWRLVHPDDRAMVGEIRQRRLSGKPVPIEYMVRGITKTGQTIWILRRNTRISYKGKQAILGNVADVTERKLAREELERSEKKYRTLTNALSQGLFEVFDALSEIASGNPWVRIDEVSELEAMTKLKSLVNLTAKNLSEIVDLSHEFAMGLAEHFDVLHKVSKGDLGARVTGTSKVELLESLKTVTNQTICSVSKEIADRKKAEEAMRASQDNYRRMAKALTLGSAEVFDALQEISYGNPLVRIDESSEVDLIAELKRMVNETAENLGEIVDLSHEFAMGLAEHFDVLHRVSRGDLKARVKSKSSVELLELLKSVTNDMIDSVSKEITARKRAKAELQKAHDELDVRVKERTAELTATNIQLRYEVEERTQAEEKLRTSEEKYRLLFDYDPNPILVVDLESAKILDTNTAATMTFGYERSALFLLPFWELFGRVEAENFRKQLHAVVGQEYIFIPKLRAKKKNGGSFFIQLYARGTLAQDPSGNLLGTLIIRMADITLRLEKDANLIQASKMATLGEMATGIAHELNQPLNVIQVGADFFSKMINRKQPVADEHILKTCQNIRTQVDRATRIINHLREFGRKSDFEVSPVDLNDPIRDVFTILGEQLRLRKIEVALSLCERPVMILADKNRLEQVFLNLITNARDAMDANELKEKVLSISTGWENGKAVARVSDTGTGMPKEVQERAFEPFFTTKEVGKGTGLGLSITYNLVKDFKGTIEVDSTEGVGTTFRLSFPAHGTDNIP
jgi:PAS domain S-box-containing protein